jgi:uncharacterized phage protein (TIGR02218 family)
MKTVTAGFRTMLRTSQQLLVADLYTITLKSGTIIYISDAPVDITVGAQLYSCSANDNEPGITRGPIKLALGLQVDSIEVNMLYDFSTVFQGTTPGAFAIAGGFDGARVKIDKLLTPDFADTSRGVVNLFNGTVSEVSTGSGRVTLSIASDLVYLNAAFPRNYLLPSCNNAFMDSSCTLTKASQVVHGTCTAGNTVKHLKASAITTGRWALGYVVITSGPNTGLVKSTRSFTSGDFELLYPFPVPCNTGDTFDAYPGCDKTEAMCDLFGNRAHFRGFPYVPTPEQVEMGSNTGGVPADSAGPGAGVGGIGRGSGGSNSNFKMK